MFSHALLLDKGNEIPVIYWHLVPGLRSLPSPQGNMVMTPLKSIHGHLLSPYPTADSDLGAEGGDADKKHLPLFVVSLWAKHRT